MFAHSLYQQLLDRAPFLAFIKTVDHRYVMANQVMCDALGKPADGFVGRLDTEVFQGENARHIAQRHEEVIRERRIITVEETLLVHGQQRNFLTSRIPLFDSDGSITAVAGIAMDTTDRDAALEDLRRSERRYRHLAEHAGHAFVSYNVYTGGFTFTNDNAERLFGATPDQLLGRSPADLSPEFQPDGRPSMQAAMEYIERALAGEDVVFDWVHQRLDGTPIPVRIWLGAEPNGDVWASMIDQQDLLESQRAVARQARLLERTQTLAKVGGWECEPSTGAMSWTLQTYRIHRLDPREFHPTLQTALSYFEDGGTAFQHAIEHTPDGESFEADMPLRTADGTTVITRVSGKRDGDEFFGAIQDITERRSLEERLIQSQKLESLGRLAGGIAHDFNNLLMVITGAVDFVEDSIPAGTAAEDIEHIKQATRRAADLTSQMLAFARQEGGTATVFDATEVVERAARMMARVIGDDVKVELDLVGGPAHVLADASHLEQILVNLILNARDAMPGGGTLTLRTLSGHPEVAPAGAGPWLGIVVADTGHGMTPDVRRRVFEPFFTTKSPGKGTGLGLSTVYGIVQRWGGVIGVESDPGRGSSFTTWWPLVQPEATADVRRASDSRPLDYDGRILLVEDDDALRRMTARGLRAMGFDVAVADSGRVALAMFDDGGRFDLVLTDVVMPGMNGFELVEDLGQRDPALQVLLMSGYAADALADRGLDPDRYALLHKPVQLQQLAEHIRGMLAR